MRAMTVIPGDADSGRLDDVDEPDPADGTVLVEGLSVGICGTDAEIMHEGYGWPPAGRERLVLGHESLGRVVQAPPVSGLSPGDLVAGIVRHPDPEPCPACARGQWDYCRNGRYTERGIKERDGFGAERWRAETGHLVRLPEQLGEVGVLAEPTSVVAKAWRQVELVAHRAWAHPRTALVTGAGPVGLLAALLGVQRGLEVTVLDRVTTGRKPELVRKLGGRYIDDLRQYQGEPDVVIEATGVAELVFGTARLLAPGGVCCLTGLSSGSHDVTIPGAALNKELVLENNVLVGSVNAARENWVDGVAALAAADRSWLESLITRRVPMTSWTDALAKGEDDVKVVVDLRD